MAWLLAFMRSSKRGSGSCLLGLTFELPFSCFLPYSLLSLASFFIPSSLLLPFSFSPLSCYLSHSLLSLVSFLIPSFLLLRLYIFFFYTSIPIFSSLPLHFLHIICHLPVCISLCLFPFLSPFSSYTSHSLLSSYSLPFSFPFVSPSSTFIFLFFPLPLPFPSPPFPSPHRPPLLPPPCANITGMMSPATPDVTTGLEPVEALVS